jgi:hypothetical protein
MSFDFWDFFRVFSDPEFGITFFFGYGREGNRPGCCRPPVGWGRSAKGLVADRS